jgi:DNA repair photolyase
MKGEVGITSTTVAEKYSKITEPGAPLPEKRLNALKQLTAKGVDTYALIGPVLNHLEGNEKDLVNAIVSTGVKRVYIDSLNARPLLMTRLSRMNMRGSDTSKEKIRKLAAGAGLEVKDVF